MKPLISGTVSHEIGARPILDEVTVEVAAGECVAIVGVNGAGKTTLLRILANVLRPTRGALSFGGRPYRSVAPRDLARSLSYVPQVRPARVPLTVRDVVLLGRYPHGSRLDFGYGAEDFEKAAAALETTGLAALADRPLSELSGGERQGVYIAAALAQDTRCLLLDEPTTYLDPGHQRRIARLLLRLTRRDGRTVVFASHDLNLAYSLADRVMVLADTRLAASGPPAEVLDAELLERVYEAPFHIHRPADGGLGHPVIAVDLDTVSRPEPSTEDPR